MFRGRKALPPPPMDETLHEPLSLMILGQPIKYVAITIYVTGQAKRMLSSRNLALRKT